MSRLELIVADDDDDLREWLTVVLHPLGARVREARCGAELLALLANGTVPDLVITDVRMPAPDGLEVLELTRAAGRSVPFLIISAFADGTVRERAARLHAAVLAKPFSARELLARVDRLVRRDGPDADGEQRR